MLIEDIIRYLEKIFPPFYAENFDNTGLLIGDKDRIASGVLVTHDVTSKVLDEAIRTDKNLIVSFHPIIFKGLKSITGRNYVERIVLKAIKNDIAIYSPHTAMDNHYRGVSDLTAHALGLTERKVLIPKSGSLMQLITYAPHDQAEQVRQALFSAGAGKIGEYDECSFNIKGKGTFRPSANANPYTGQKGTRHVEPETRISVVFPAHLQSAVTKAMIHAHPYEEPAYEILSLQNPNPETGLGSLGKLPSPMGPENFLKHVKKILKTPVLRHSALTKKNVETVAILGGSGAFAIDYAMAAGADAFISGDLKYHDFFKAEGKMLIIDAGHYESERFVADELVRIISEKFPNFAVSKTQIQTNPINYT